MSFVPTINLLNDSPEHQATVIKHALGTVGFLAVENSGIAAEEINAMFARSGRFFANSAEVKSQYTVNADGVGYTRPRAQALGDLGPDNKETLLYGKYSSFKGQELPPPFRDDEEDEAALKEFYKKCHDVSEKLLELFALALLVPVEHFRKWHNFGVNTVMSLIHYPSLSGDQRAALQNVDIRAGEHKDWGTLTMLFQQPNGPPGLQAWLPEDINTCGPTGREPKMKWWPAPVPSPGGFLVNIGLVMEVWSGGQYRATLHRVIFPPAEDEAEAEGLVDRYTIAYFVQPDREVVLQPIRSGGEIDITAETMTSGELWDLKQKESFDRVARMTRGIAA